MRETNFIEQNKDKWKEFEHILEHPNADPDKLNRLFVQISDDLSYARTFYPNRSVRVYLNGLAQRIFIQVYRKRRQNFRRLFRFWTDELPLLVYETRRNFLISFLVCLLAFGIGLVSSIMDPEFAEIILGQNYIEMTETNIESGDPMAVYKDKGRFGMFLAITLNNLQVDFLIFVMGALYGVGTLIILFKNAIMVGTFQYFFIERGLFWESFLTIWIHGTLEISAMVIAGAAGLTLGRGMAFPGTLNRMRSFQKSAKRGLKIIIGIVPITILAGFFEGYFTRHTETPDLIRLIFILGNLAFVIYYFGIYPRLKASSVPEDLVKKDYLTPDSNQEIEYSKIKKSGEIFNEAFHLLRKNWRPIVRYSFLVTLIYSLILFLLSGNKPSELFYFPEYYDDPYFAFFSASGEIPKYFKNDAFGLLPLVLIPLIAIYFTAIFRLVAKSYKSGIQLASFSLQCLQLLPAAGLIYLMLWTDDWYTLFLLLFLIMIPLLWMYAVVGEQENVASGLSRSLSLLSQNYGKSLSLSFVFLLIGILFFSILDSFLFSFYLDILSWVVSLSPSEAEEFTIITQVASSMFMLFLIMGLFALGFGLLYYSLVEVKDARGLIAEIKKMAIGKTIRGLEREN